MCDLDEEAELVAKIQAHLLECRADLDLLANLPKSWLAKCLKRLSVDIADFPRLREALSDCPKMTSEVVWLLDAYEAQADARHRRRPPPEWATNLMQDQRAQNAFRAFEVSVEYWQACLHLMPIALQAAKVGESIRHVGPETISLIDASTERIQELGEMRAHNAQALDRAGMKDGVVPSHPRERQTATHVRRLRVEAKRATAWMTAILGLVGGRNHNNPTYADNFTLDRWRGTQAANRAFISKHDVISEDGTKLPLAEVVAFSEEATRASWYAIVLGLRERGNRDGLIPVFVTVTLPAKWHPNPAKGRSSYDSTLSPHAAIAELGERWSRVRALLRKRKVNYYGIRTAEPHSDGTPHLHFVLWVSPSDPENLESSFRLHFPEPFAGADIACKIKIWDAAGKADPASYVMHYVMKGLRSEEQAEPDDTAARARAWASFLGLRRLSLVGLAPGILGRWRAAYKLLRQSDPDRPVVASGFNVNRVLGAFRKNQ